MTRLISAILFLITFLASRGKRSEIHHAIAKLALWICGYGLVTGSPAANLMWLVCFIAVAYTDGLNGMNPIEYILFEAKRILYRIMGKN